MEVSKFYMAPRVTRGERQRSLLEWLHKASNENPRTLKDTSVLNLAKQYLAANPNVHASESAVRQTLSNMINKNVLVKEGNAWKRRSNFRINYLHPAIPGEMLDSMSEEAKRFVKSVNDRLEKKKADGEDVELDGATEAIITKPKKESYEELKARTEKEKASEEPEEPEETGEQEETEEQEEKTEEQEEKTEEEPITKLDADKIAMLAALAAMVGKANPEPVAQPVEVKKEGGNISLTININLNGMLK